MTTPFHWPRAAAFFERIDRLNLHGLHFQHVRLCQRRAWMHLHGISFAQWNRNVQIGTARHDTSYARDRSTRGLFGLAPDRIDWKRYIVYESKGTGGAVEAVSDQTAFYALLLSIATGKTWHAVTHVLSTRKQRKVVLDDLRMQQLWESSERLEQLAEQTSVPSAKPIPLCASCSLAAFCGHD